MPNPNLMSHAESKLIVRWLRRAKRGNAAQIPLDFFYQRSVEDVVAELKEVDIKVTQLEVLEASRRVIAV